MSPTDLAALRRLVDILGGPRAEEVPAEALHAVALVKGWKVEKGLRDVWLLWDGAGHPERPDDVDRAWMVRVLRAGWVPLAVDMIKSGYARGAPFDEALPTWVGPDGKAER